MTDVLLTHSFLLRFDPKQQKLGQAYAPLGTLYAASMLRKNGISFQLYDPIFADSPDEIIPVMNHFKPGILAIYDDGFNYLSKMCLNSMREATFRMIHAAKDRGMKIVIWSVDANDSADLYLDQGADFCILGEGELTLVQILERLTGKTDTGFYDIRGITWKSKDGRQTSIPRGIASNLDDFPFPAWDLLDIERYRKLWIKKNGRFTLNMVTTRGCPYGCIWCAKPVYGNHYNSRSPRNVVDELELLKKNYGPDSIWYADDIFGLKPGWVDEYARLVRERNIIVPYTMQSRVDLLIGNGQISPLASSGCTKVWLGIESGSQKILDAMHKGTTTEQARIASSKLREAGIQQAFFLQLGFPGENREDLDKTLKLITDLMPDDIGISVTYPLPGTPFYDAVKNQIKEKTNWSDSDDLAMLFKSSYPPSFYRYMHRFIHKYYRFRQAKFYLEQFFSKKLKLKGDKARRVFLLPYYFVFSVIYRFLSNRSRNAGS